MKKSETKEHDSCSINSEDKLYNWAGNIFYRAKNVVYPGTIEEVQEYVQKHMQVKVLGTRHCFNRIADSSEELLCTRGLNRVVELDRIQNTVTIEGGIKYGELAQFLFSHGYALHNLASLPHISVAGSIATGTHGSGMKLKNLAGAVLEIEMIKGDGDLVRLSREHDEQFFAAVVGLGALGIVTKLKLDIEKSFEVRQFVFTDLPLSAVKEHFTEIMSSAYSVSLFTDWKSSFINEVWLKSREEKDLQLLELNSFYGAAAAKENLHPIKSIPAMNCTEQLGVPGPWHERLPHFKMGFMPSAGNELQSEYFIPLANAVEALSIIAGLAELIWPYLYVSEIRTIAADEFWMSPCFQQDSVAIHFTWKDNWEAVRQILPVIEKGLLPLGGRPHWGKLFTMTSADISPFYPKWVEFKKIADFYDPQKKFRNDFLNQYVFDY